MNKIHNLDGPYPCLTNFVEIKKIKDRIFIVDYVMHEKKEISSRVAEYCMKLNGYTDPLWVEGFTKEECIEYYMMLDEELYVRKGRKLDLGDTLLYTLYIPRKVRTKSIIPKIYNWLLMILCIPTFILGVNKFSFEYLSDASLIYYVFGFILGIVTGSIAHEMSHAMANLAYGGCFLEAGLSFRGFPGAYCLVASSTINKKNKRMKQLQVNLAGVEMNLLLAGIYLLLVIPVYANYKTSPVSCLLYMAAFQNFIFVLINLIFFKGMDGEHALGNILGNEYFDEDAKENLRYILDKASRREFLLNNGINGVAYICVACTVLLIQSGILVFMAGEITYVLGGGIEWLISIIF